MSKRHKTHSLDNNFDDDNDEMDVNVEDGEGSELGFSGEDGPENEENRCANEAPNGIPNGGRSTPKNAENPENPGQKSRNNAENGSN